MKKNTFAVLFILVCMSLFAQGSLNNPQAQTMTNNTQDSVTTTETVGKDSTQLLTADMTLNEISKATQIPMTKLFHYLGIAKGTNRTAVVKDLGIDSQTLNTVADRYHHDKQIFFWGIVVIGMVVVFISLFVIQHVIGILRHANKTDEPKKPQMEVNTPSKAEPTTHTSSIYNEDTKAAAIAAIYLYEADVAEKNKQIKFQRNLFPHWKMVSLINMPNAVHQNLRK